MGTWGTGISSNDTFGDVYDEFFDYYNDGMSVKEISEELINLNWETLDIPEDANNFWFALALSQWECKALDECVLKRVEHIIISKSDLEIWKESGASNSDLKKREKVLEKFLEKLKSEKKSARKIKPKVFIDSIFSTGDCLTYIMENGNYGGAFVLTDEQNTEVGVNFIAVTKINKSEKPTLNDFKNAEILIRRQQNAYFENLKPFFKWDEKPVIGIFMAKLFKKENVNIEVVGKLKIYKNYKPEKTFAAYGWKQLLKMISNSDEYEKINGISKSKVKLSKWTKWHCL